MREEKLEMRVFLILTPPGLPFEKMGGGRHLKLMEV